ncbi:MAG TPA: FAD-dependent oxidoreductase [Chthoniobacteraceae bacterium]|nr:FAD-dependent oxidoreductase [Chthoniobacteraceae bacterium]
MDLRTGETVWQLDDAPHPVLGPLENDLSCEVAIVGGGITGVLVAHELTSSGIDCALIDKAQLGAGSTAASTALLLYELDTPLHLLAQQIGEDNAVLAYRACHEAIGDIEQLISNLGDCADFRRRKSFYLAEHERDISLLEREHQLRRKHGMAVDLLSRADIESRFSFSRPAALLSHDAAELDVVKFVHALARNAQAHGLRAYGDTKLQNVDRVRDGRRFVLRTEHGACITARRIVFATGYAAHTMCPPGRIGDLKSTYAIATAPLPNFAGWHERALIWTTARPYLYLRTTASNRAIIGGEDVPFVDDEKRDALLRKKSAVLARSLRDLFPEMEFEVACAWTGTFAETKDSIAFIGESPSDPGIYFALGYGGNGIAYSMVAAQILREACRGRQHPFAHVFRLDRT